MKVGECKVCAVSLDIAAPHISGQGVVSIILTIFIELSISCLISRKPFPGKSINMKFLPC